MKIGFIGLGRMGAALVEHALEQGIDIVSYNRTAEKVDELIKKTKDASYRGRLIKASTVEELVRVLEGERVIWMMLPQGEPVDEMIRQLVDGGLERDDTLIDGGNCFYKDSIKHAQELSKLGIHYLDVGTSGGIEGARLGACLMIGGAIEDFERCEPLFKKLATTEGYAYFGPSGAGHFVKMVHNGVEYGMLQAIGEGFELLKKSQFQLNLHSVSKTWRHGSVVRGWLMDLLERALRNDEHLEHLEGVVGGGTTGKWTVETAKEMCVETPVIEASLKAREKSIDSPTFSGKVVATLRNQFGGHEVKKK